MADKYVTTEYKSIPSNIVSGLADNLKTTRSSKSSIIASFYNGLTNTFIIDIGGDDPLGEAMSIVLNLTNRFLIIPFKFPTLITKNNARVRTGKDRNVDIENEKIKKIKKEKKG